MRTMDRIVFGLFLIGVSSAQIIQDGQCDENIQLQSDFSVESFAGTWYEIRKSSDLLPKGDCGSIQINRLISNETRNETDVNIFVNEVVNRNFADSVTGVAIHENGTAKFTLDLLEVENEIDFWIISTNYIGYSVAYSCRNIDSNSKSVSVWGLTRSRTPNNFQLILISNALRDVLGIDDDDTDLSDHSDDACYVLPVIDDGEPIILPGKCDPDMVVQQNFTVEEFLGTWHEIARYYTEDVVGTCTRSEYTASDDRILVLNSRVIDQALDTTSGFAVLKGDDKSARITVTLEVSPDVFSELDLIIISTDYTSYAIAYNCIDLPNDEKRVYSWILSRRRQLPPSTEIQVNQIIDSIIDLNNAYYQETNQTDEGCFYFPEPSPDKIVVFRGPCAENIPVVGNFDISEYMGLWHDIESYPYDFQGGTCNNALYTMTNNSIEVFTTQVINETLDTMSGTAIQSDGNNGKFVVNFPIAGANTSTEFDYWVLATDYSTYSLVYTCVYNPETDERQIFSWKLSRSKQLTTEANEAINNVTNNIPVLDQQYYIKSDQSPGACFYFPEPEPDVTVIFPGQCDLTIPVVEDFSLENFNGTWYEIQTYPKEFLLGECVRHSYAQSGTTLDGVTSAVVDQFLEESSSVITSSDNSARMTMTINDNFTLPFWILATDYDNYALAYSCMNLNDDFRAIHSWKLSRTQELNPTANTEINNFIANANIEVLDNVYFHDVGQTDDDCFYLPELAPGEPVELVGQCDPDIKVVENFDANQYDGLWHIIEQYPTDFQDGDCNDATYKVQDNNSIQILTTRVINETLDSAIGTASIATNDNSAKFTVTIQNTTIDYWILDTDYASYSLAYSCVNLPNNRRRVRSWKMSRTRTLTANANNAINQIIDDIQVLNNRYFEVVNNTDSACFYYPQPNGQPLVFRGVCDKNIAVVPDFQVDLYSGVWYSIENYPVPFQYGTCTTATYGIVEDGVHVFNTQVVNQTRESIIGIAVNSTATGEAKFTVTFALNGTNRTVGSPYWVLDTDYNNYALVYSCQDINVTNDQPLRSVSSWKLSRERTLSPESESKINHIMRNVQVLRQDYYEPQGHSDDDCFYYPEVVVGEPVIFPGQCNDSIMAVAGFDISLYNGTWYEIESYPNNQHAGQCINYEFSGTDGISLAYSQVNRELLETSIGSAIFESTDGSAKFRVRLNTGSSEIEFSYWILATDYNNYALAYSCMNVNSTFRGVWSWKLSRQKHLTENDSLAINNAISNIDVLDQRYYVPVSQTDEACFYYPELGPNEPVTFPGQCNQSIPVVENFDVAQFAGRWFDIESYYDGYEGDCVDSTFTNSGNVFNIHLTRVVNATLDATNSRAVISSDNSGKLIVTLDNTEYEYWILATDYTDYALIYSCQDISENRRRVRSWKLSKRRQLSNNAKTAINNIIDTINVLDAQYYNPRDHTEQGCFYYPVPEAGKQVKFRGRCDGDIPVVRDFDVNRFMSYWYNIESYPSEFEEGTCATAYYEFDPPETIRMRNSQVVAQRLQVKNVTAVSVSNDLAKLEVILSDTESRPYWVLDTDYDNYALIYSCTEEDDEYKIVNSWKLSRSQSGLTSTANDAINNVMNTIPVLRQDYYEVMPHTAEACFFYPPITDGKVILEGQCPDAKDIITVANFSSNLFSQPWHEVFRFPSEIRQGSCATKHFVATTPGFILDTTLVVDERLVTGSGPAVLSADGRAIFSSTLFDEDNVAVPLDLYVLATDYTEYALLYSCRNIDNETKQIYSWQLSRSRDGLSPEAIDVIDEIVHENEDLFEDYYKPMDQSNDGCFYYPEFETLPDVIELPGPCDDRIRGVPDFNSSAYLGRWFELARYPEPNQVGKCGRAEYQDNDGIINVVNSEVINQTLHSYFGTATVSSDGSGVLEVTIVQNGESRTTNYYILGTDYTTYSLVYSCRNLDNGNRTVLSWILSRTRQLNDEANQGIEIIISNTQGLTEDYYIQSSQTDEDCFYIPELDETLPVVFRGECANVTGMQGFDMQQYVGWWHEVESYPTGNEGLCRSSRYTGSGTNFQVVDAVVNGLEADINSYTVTATSDGRLTRRSADGYEETWIVLDTDYQNYALLYSCEEINNEYRRVWSAKHSKTAQLTEAAQNAMGAIIEANPVLYNQFYLKDDQSDEACFFYPRPDGKPVTLRGQCDRNIPVVTNFQIDEFTGRWYQIERYPQEWERGNCTGLQYRVNNAEEKIDLLIWQVVNGELDIMEGNATLIESEEKDGIFSIELPPRIPEETGIDSNTAYLYILATDYESYALTFSCYNVNEYEQRVSAWKFSRTRSLSSAGNAAINQYMSTRRELDQRYFETVPQDENCNEPASGYLVKSSVLLLLVCGILQIFM